MNKTFKILFITLSVAVVSAGVYFKISNTAEGQTEPRLVSETTNQPVGIPSLNSEATDKAIQDAVRQINDLDKIKLNTAIFEKPEFLALKDISQELPAPTDVGRPNPFAQIGLDVGVISGDETFGATALPSNFGLPEVINDVRTKEVINIGRTSATVNAEVSILGPTARWFEYGTNENTVNKTAKQNGSDATFSATLTGLQAKTTYYVKSAVDQSGTVTYGELVSFKTAE